MAVFWIAVAVGVVLGAVVGIVLMAALSTGTEPRPKNRESGGGGGQEDRPQGGDE